MRRIYLILVVCILSAGLFAQPNRPATKKQQLEEQLFANITFRKRPIQNSSLKQYRIKVHFDLYKNLANKTYRGFVLQEAQDMELGFRIRLKQGEEKLITDTLRCYLGDTIVSPFKDSLNWKLADVRLVQYHSEIVYKRKASRQLVDQYYLSANTLTNIKNGILALSFSDPDRLMDDKNQMDQFVQQLVALEELRFPRKLNLPNYDPQAYMSRQAELRQLIEQKEQDFALALDNIHVLYYEKAMATGHMETRRAGLLKALEKAREINRPFAEPHVALAELDMHAGAYLDAVSRLEAALASNPSAALAEQCRFYARDIYMRILNNGANNGGQFAIDWYYMAMELCGRPIISGNCNAVQREVMAIRTALFESLIDERSYAALADAQQYLELFRVEILYPEKLYIALQRRYKMHLVEVQQMSRNRQLDAALQEIKVIRSREMDFGIPFEDRQAVQRTYQEIYDTSLGIAEEANAARAYQQALNSLAFSEKVLRETPGIDRNQNRIEAQYQTAYLGLFDQQLADVKAKTDARKFGEAEQALGRLKQFRDQHKRYLQEHYDVSLERSYTYFYEEKYDAAVEGFNTRVSQGQFASAFSAYKNLLRFQREQARYLAQRPEHMLQRRFDRFLPLYLEDLDRTHNRPAQHLAELEILKDLNAYVLAGSEAAYNLNDRMKRLVNTHIDYEAQELRATIRTLDVDNCPPSRLDALQTDLRRVKDFAADNRHVWSGEQELVIRQVEDFYFQAHCSNQADIFADLMRNIEGNLKNAAYVQAFGIMDKALAFAREEASCNIPTGRIRDYQNRYRHAFEYQSNKQKAMDAFYRRSYKDGISFYNQAEDLERKEAVAAYDLEHVSLKDYIWAVDNRNLQVFYLKHLVEQNEDIDLINAFVDRFYSWGNKKRYYKDLGLALGRLEHRRYDSYKTGLLQYHAHKGGAYRGFKKGYKKGFKV